MPKFVFLVNDDGYKKYTYLAAKAAGASVPKIEKGWGKTLFKIHNAEPLNRWFELPLKCIWYSKVIDEKELDKNDEIYFILYESFYMSFSRRLIKHYKKKYRKAKFIFIFTNPASQYNIRRVNKIKDLLDAVFSFNKADTIEYGYRYQKTDLLLLPVQQIVEKKTDVFFIGADKGRLSILIDIFEKLNGEGLICDFWITGVPKEKQRYSDIIHYNKRLTYEEVLQHDVSTRCIIEILQDKKSYSSIRTMEAIQYHKKLLTMSDTVKEQWFYRNEIIQVFHNAREISVDFIRSKVDESIYDDLDVGSFKRFEEFIIREMAD